MLWLMRCDSGTDVPDRTNYYCDPCRRYFGSNEALEPHWLNSSQHDWCQRCNRFFGSEDALDNHFQNSRSHWICDDHDLDFLTWKELEKHYVEDEDHLYCETCVEHFKGATQLRTVGLSLHAFAVLVDSFHTNLDWVLMDFSTLSIISPETSNVGVVMKCSTNIRFCLRILRLEIVPSHGYV